MGDISTKFIILHYFTGWAVNWQALGLVTLGQLIDLIWHAIDQTPQYYALVYSLVENETQYRPIVQNTNMAEADVPHTAATRIL